MNYNIKKCIVTFEKTCGNNFNVSILFLKDITSEANKKLKTQTAVDKPNSSAIFYVSVIKCSYYFGGKIKKIWKNMVYEYIL